VLNHRQQNTVIFTNIYAYMFYILSVNILKYTIPFKIDVNYKSKLERDYRHIDHADLVAIQK
jgi:hypothetical protein